MNNEIKAALDRVKATTPLVHNITNYVTVNDCANALLAIGASPIMSDEPEDVTDITTICGGLVLNIGTLNRNSIEAMMVAGRRAGDLGHAIVLDPVGAGASALRTKTAATILDECRVSVVRGNMSEIKALASGATSTRGVDACPDDAVTPENLEQSARFVKEFARATGCVVAVTGAIDIVADAQRAFAVYNGTPLQGHITGAGCMLSCLCGAFVTAADDEQFLSAAVASVALMGTAGDVAVDRMTGSDGSGSFRTYLIDALYAIDGDYLGKHARIEEIR